MGILDILAMVMVGLTNDQQPTEEHDMTNIARIITPKTCDFCRHPSINKEEPALYDFKTTFGPWANGCEAHYLEHRAYPDLGTGKGQKLVLIQGVG